MTATAPDLFTVVDYTTAIEEKLQTRPAALDHAGQQAKFGELVDLYLARAARLEELATLAAETTSAEVVDVLRLAAEGDTERAKHWRRHAKGVEKQHKQRRRPQRLR